MSLKFFRMARRGTGPIRLWITVVALAGILGLVLYGGSGQPSRAQSCFHPQGKVQIALWSDGVQGGAPTTLHVAPPMRVRWRPQGWVTLQRPLVVEATRQGLTLDGGPSLPQSAEHLWIEGQTPNQPLVLTKGKGGFAYPPRHIPGLLHIGRKHTVTPVLEVTASVDAKDYVMGVVASEMLPQWIRSKPGTAPKTAPGSGAVQAQSVIVQTWLRRKAMGQGGLPTLKDSTSHQSFQGVSRVNGVIRDGVMSTWGQWLGWHKTPNQPLDIYYHSTCAGETSTAPWWEKSNGKSPQTESRFWAVACTFCKDSPFFKPLEHRLSLKEYEAWLRETWGVYTVSVKTREPSGRPVTLLGKGRNVRGQEFKEEIDAYEFWMAFGRQWGWDKLPGNRFTLKELPKEGVVAVTSRGAGHGVGLCQWGAFKRSESGHTYREILKHYYPQSHLNGASSS